MSSSADIDIEIAELECKLEALKTKKAQLNHADASSTKDQAGKANAFSEIDEDGDGKLRRWGRIRKHVFLKGFASPSVCKKMAFKVPKDYDYTKTTNDNYKADDGDRKLCGRIR